MSHEANASPVVVVSRAEFPPQPMQTSCPHCHANVLTDIKYKAGKCSWILFAFLCIFGCWLGCCLIPFCAKGVQDVEHYCPTCKVLIGTYRR